MIIDYDDNYYDATDILPPKHKDGKDYFTRAPLYMQKVAVPPTNRNFIQVGMVGSMSGEETKGIFMRRTKELEEGERQMFKNLAQAIAPDVIKMAALSKSDKGRIEEYITAQEELRDKKAAQALRKYQRELEDIERQYSLSVKYAKSRLQELNNDAE